MTDRTMAIRVGLLQAIRRSALVATLLGAAWAAQALPVVQGFEGQGQTAPTGHPAPNNGLEVAVLGASYTFTVLDGGVVASETDWGLKSIFEVDGLALGMPGASRGSGEFVKSGGVDRIAFAFTGEFLGFDAGGFINYLLTYDVTGGAGRFAGADGKGSERVSINAGDFSFKGAGRFDLVPGPNAVPLPPTLALVAVAALALVGTRRRPGGRKAGVLRHALARLGLALPLGLLAGGALAQTPQYSYIGSYSAFYFDERAFGDVRSSLGQPPAGGAGLGNTFALITAGLDPLAFTSARAGTGEGHPISGTSASGVMTLSYSVLFTPTTAAAQSLAAAWGASGRSFGQVAGIGLLDASGRASASLRAQAESGGYGVDAGQFSNRHERSCGAPGTLFDPLAPNSGCGTGNFTLQLYLVPLPGTESFVGRVSLRASAESGAGNNALGTTVGGAYAFVDPLITLDPQLEGTLVLGGGAIANAVPEPAAGVLMLAGVGLLVAVRRRQRGEA